MAKPRKEGASAFIGLAHHRIDPDILRNRLQEREQRAATDTRTDAEKWLGDPPALQSALTQSSQPTPRRNAGQRVDLWKR